MADGALLAVDLGVRTGLALYGGDGRLVWVRSRNLGSVGRVRRAAPSLLRGLPPLAFIVTEGDRTLGEHWARAASPLGAAHRPVYAETWRDALLSPADRRDAEHAKKAALRLADRVVRHFGARAPKSMRHDAAEAVLVGLWAVLDLGWLSSRPPGL